MANNHKKEPFKKEGGNGGQKHPHQKPGHPQEKRGPQPQPKPMPGNGKQNPFKKENEDFDFDIQIDLEDEE